MINNKIQFKQVLQFLLSSLSVSTFKDDNSKLNLEMPLHLEISPEVVDGDEAFVGLIEGLETLDVLVDLALGEVEVRLL